MSSIDSTDNIHCANVHLGTTNIPIYWVQENANRPYRHDETGEVVTKYDLMIGGGSGEHPALHIKNADLLPIWLMIRHSDNIEEEALLTQLLQNRVETQAEKDSIARYHLAFCWENFVDYSLWPISTLAKLQAEFESYNQLHFTEIDLEFVCHSAEVGFLAAIAKFVRWEMPQEFYGAGTEDLMLKVKTGFLPYLHDHSMVQFSAPLQGSKAGKVIRDGKVIWGFSLFDYQFEKLRGKKGNLSMSKL